MALPAGFQPSDEWAKGNVGMSLADFYKNNPGVQQQYQQQQTLQENSDPIKVAEKARQYNIQANQPVVQQLQQTKTDLGSQYKQLLDSIKGQQGVAENAQTLATNNELGRRGISNDSGIYEQQMASSLRPIAQQYQTLTANTGLSQQKDMQDLALQIANLQAGNPSESLNFGQGVANQAQQASQFQQNLAQQLAVAELQNQPKQEERYKALGEGQTLYDLLNGGAVFTAPKTYKPETGSSGGGNYYNSGGRYEIVG